MSQSNSLVEDNIRQCIAKCRAIAGDDRRLQRIISALDVVEDRMDSPMQLAIIGRISSSKSTLVNAILGIPEVVSTGHEAETFNVSWLKYGSNTSPMRIHFKNGTTIEVSRSEWKKWASHGSQEMLKNQVQFIEIYLEEEILKAINIIDTPGLDALSRVDSENTKAFLKKVNPDAVVMVFTKSLSEDSLKLIEDFQKSESSFSYHINPMNALGILSKMDLNWNILSTTDPLISSAKAINRTLTSRTDVTKSIFQILPVSALIGLASANVDDEEFLMFKKLSTLDKNLFLKKLINADAFVREDTTIPIDVPTRKALLAKYGLYGIHCCTEFISNNTTATKTDLSKILRQKSGFDRFMFLIQSHFGRRASLIKAHKAIGELLNSCNSVTLMDSVPHTKINTIRYEIDKIEECLHELKEWRVMLDIYESKITLDGAFVEEFKRVCGEKGYSVLDKLDCDGNTAISDIIAKAKERATYWLTKYNMRKRLTGKGAEPYRVLSKSYLTLAENISEQDTAYNEAIKTINLYNLFIYGKE